MSNERIFLTGGAGYIGSHVALALLELGYPVVILDNLSTGHREIVPEGCEFIEGEVGDQALLTEIFREYGITAVMHFAGSIVVEESVREPVKYYENNTHVALRLIESCVRENIRNFIFSSTAAVYGNPEKIPVTETAPLAPINPYGHSKAMVEQILQDVSHSSSLNYIALRYFNVAGADPKRRSGQVIEAATHLIKVACETALNKRESITVFGNDYPTADGTCVRDYIHVSDLAMAHVKALEYLSGNDGGLVLNCGYGEGYSVQQVLDTLQEVHGGPIQIKQGDRRPGDPAALIADNSRLCSLLDWEPRYNNLRQIIEDALEWEKIINV